MVTRSSPARRSLRRRIPSEFWRRFGCAPLGVRGERVVQKYAPLRCSPKLTPSGIAKRVHQNIELAERALKVLAMSEHHFISNLMFGPAVPTIRLREIALFVGILRFFPTSLQI
jgi:hypothetical protein